MMPRGRDRRRSPHPLRAARALMLAACAIALPAAPGFVATAHAQVSDYAPANSDWNGLSSWVGLAGRLGYRVESRTALSFAELGPGDVVVVLYPTARPSSGQLYEYVRRGGRLLFADDYGAGEYAMATLGLPRAAPTSTYPRLYRGNPALPIALPTRMDHPLAQGVSELVANHPTAFTALPENTIFQFAPDQGLVAAGELGRGRFIALSDPSLFINCMMELPGNVAFASNALRWLADGADTRGGVTPRLFLLGGDLTLLGEPAELARSSDPVGGRVTDVNDLLSELNEYLANDWILRAVGILLGGGLFALAVTAAFPRRRVLPHFGLQAPALDVANPRAGPASRSRPHLPPDFAAAAGALRAGLDLRLAHVCGVPEPLATLDPRSIVPRLGLVPGEPTARAVLELLERAQRLPTGAQQAAGVAPRRVTKRDFELLHAAWLRAKDALPSERAQLRPHSATIRSGIG